MSDKSQYNKVIVYGKQKEEKPMGKNLILVAIAAFAVIGIIASFGDDGDSTHKTTEPTAPQAAVSAGTPADAQGDESATNAESALPSDPEPEIVILDSVTYSGSGDDVIEIQPFGQPWMMHITGNSGGRHFAVKGYDSNAEPVDLFVNVSDPYDGYVFDHTQSTTTLEISAEGAWSVELVSLYTADVLDVDTPIAGQGDRVLAVAFPDILWTLHVAGNSGEHHFAVKGYDPAFDSTELFVNTSEYYDGVTLDASQSTAYLAVTSESDWTIEIVEARNLTEANQGDTITGNGDMVIMTDTVGSTATISGNSGANHFAVKSYSYTNSDLLVNTTDPYEGKVMLEFDPTLMVVTAEGDWSITFN